MIQNMPTSVSLNTSSFCLCQNFFSCDVARNEIKQINANLGMHFQQLNDYFTFGNNMKIEDTTRIELSRRVSDDVARCDILTRSHFLSWMDLWKINRISKELCGLAQFLQDPISLPSISVSWFPYLATRNQMIYFPVVLTIYHSPKISISSVHNIKLFTRKGDSTEDILLKSPIEKDVKSQVVPVNQCCTRILIKELIPRSSTKLLVAELFFQMDVKFNEINVCRLEAKKAVSSIIISNKIQLKKAFIELLKHTLQMRNMKQDIDSTLVYDCINLLELVLHEVFGIADVHPKGGGRRMRKKHKSGNVSETEADIIGMEGEKHRPFSWIERKFLWDLFKSGNQLDLLEMLSRFEMVYPVDKNMKVYMQGGVWMLERSHAQILLDECDPGTFLLRFSRTSTKAICIAFVNRFPVVKHRVLSEEQSKDLMLDWEESVEKWNLQCALCVNKDGVIERIRIEEFIPLPHQPSMVHKNCGFSSCSIMRR